jgi:hypothetical protein
MTSSHPLKPTNMFQRLFCVTISPRPADSGCWDVAGDRLTIELARAPEIGPAGGALRLEDGRLPDRVLVVHGEDGQYRAFRDRCACGGFRIDPVPGEPRIRCCTPMQSTYEYSGKPLSKHVTRSLDLLPTTLDGGRLSVDIGLLREPAPHARKGA